MSNKKVKTSHWKLSGNLSMSSDLLGKRSKGFRGISFSILTAVVGAAAAVSFLPGAVLAQTANNVNSEWVEASSPLPGGGRVTTTYVPGSGNAPVTTVTRGPIGSISSQRPQLTTANLNNVPLSTQAGAINPIAGSRQFGNTGLAPVRTANGTTLMPVVSYVPVSGNYYNPGAIQQVQLQSPGLCPTPIAGTRPVVGTNGGVYGPLPGQAVNPANPGFFPTQPVRPTGTGYRALIPRPLPAGTYIGQGWLGQPKAYVNNQPLRNALRYLIIP